MISKNSPRPLHSITGFTLIELLTVIAIIGILAAILIPTIGAVRTQARVSLATSNLRSIHNVVSLYANDHRNVFPSASANPAPNPDWLRALWNYEYPNRTFPGYGAALVDTIYYTPLLEDGATARSFGFNGRLEQALPSRRYHSFHTPSQVALIGDVKTSSAFTPAQANPRNRGRVGVCFLDGHVSQMLLVDVPTSYGDPFWSGR